MGNRVLAFLGVISAIIILAMLNFTTPTGVGPLGVLIFFLALYLLMLEISISVVKIFGRIFWKKKGMTHKDYLYAFTIAFGPIVLLFMQSFAAINVATIILAAIFVGLICFLINKKA